MLHSFADLSRMLDQMMGGVIGGLWAILGFGVCGGRLWHCQHADYERAGADPRVGLAPRRCDDAAAGPPPLLLQAGIIGLIGLGLGIIDGISTAYAIGKHDAAVGVSGRLPLASLASGGMSRLWGGVYTRLRHSPQPKGRQGWIC